MKYVKRTFTFLMLLFIVFQLSLMFIENLYTYQTMRFFQVACSVGAFGPMVTYVYEICGKKYRSGRFFSGNMSQITSPKILSQNKSNEEFVKP